MKLWQARQYEMLHTLSVSYISIHKSLWLDEKKFHWNFFCFVFFRHQCSSSSSFCHFTWLWFFFLKNNVEHCATAENLLKSPARPGVLWSKLTFCSLFVEFAIVSGETAALQPHNRSRLLFLYISLLLGIINCMKIFLFCIIQQRLMCRET